MSNVTSSFKVLNVVVAAPSTTVTDMLMASGESKQLRIAVELGKVT